MGLVVATGLVVAWVGLPRRQPSETVIQPGSGNIDTRTPPGPASPIQLRDVTQATGITFVHADGSSGQPYIVETVTAGLALFDYDADGWIDIFVLNDVAANFLFENNGTGKFY